MKVAIKDFYGKILGYVDTDNKGNKIVTDFYGKILGKYDKSMNVTKDFYGRIIARGDCTGMLFNQ